MGASEYNKVLPISGADLLVLAKWVPLLGQ